MAWLKVAVAVFLFTLPLAAAPRAHEPEMSWLDNGVIRLGADLNLGGAITWLSRSSDALNVVNSFDWGRQIQMSYYAGPVPFSVGEKRPAKSWEHIGWNPIQVGDDFGHRSRVLEHRNDERTLYVKCVPMQWPLDDVPGECTFECWLELDGASVRAHCRLNNTRADHTQYEARGQELPAVYTNGQFYRLMTYTGDRPFTGDALTQIKTKGPVEGWSQWFATENWSALVNDAGWGLGVWNPDCVQFGGGFNAAAGDDACGYIAPNRVEILDHNIVHEYRYDLVLGTLEEIRAHAQRRVAAPSWHFAHDRQGWSYHHATDTGWPVSGELDVHLDESDPWIVSPMFFCRAEDAPTLVFDAAFRTTEKEAQIFWSDLASGGFSEKRSLRFPVIGDGEFHEVRVRLADSPEYRGAIIQLRLDPANAAGGSVRLRAVRLER